MAKLALVLIVWFRAALTPGLGAQQARQALPNSETSGPILTAVPACPISASARPNQMLQINYFPSRPGALIPHPRGLSLRLVFDGPFFRDNQRTVPFDRQSDGSWKATVPLEQQWHIYAIWYVRDEDGKRDDNHGQYWDLVFCDADGKRNKDGVRSQVQGYMGAIFANDLKRTADYDTTIRILESNIDNADPRSANLVSDEWALKFRHQPQHKIATPEMVEEIEKELSKHAGQSGYILGTAQFLVNFEDAFPPAMVEKAAALADHQTNSPGFLVQELDRSRAERVKDPGARARALAAWLAKYPQAPMGNYVRKERLGSWSDLGDVVAAEECFDDLQKRAPEDADLYATMAAIYVRAAAGGRKVDLNRALMLLDKAEATLGSPPNTAGGPGYFFTLGLGGLDQQKAIIHFWRGRAFFEQQNWAQAVKSLEAATSVLEDDRPVWEAYLLIGRAQENLQQWEAAKHSYLEAALRSSESVDKFVELSLRTGTPSREAALKELAGAKKRAFKATNYKPELVDLRLPDFTLTTAAGKPITSSSLRGQIVVLDLWATWCGSCIWELRGLVELKQMHPEIKLLLPAIDSTIPDIEKVLYPLGFSSNDVVLIDSPNAAKFGESGIPQTYVIDKAGRIRVIHYGGLTDVVSLVEADLAAIGSE
ncbi:MAG TPA: redoxin domain-containing protein [Candidatus Angelobacter sp.]|nr:redoxin domain-containing protein [Candidatus Angelobacter sp.]